MTQIIELGTSAASSLRTCEKKYVYAEIERLEPRITSVSHNSPMMVGSWVHLGLATHYSGGEWKQALGELQRHHDPYDANKYVQSIAYKANSLLESYFYHYTVLGKDRGYENFQTVCVEEPFTFDTVVQESNPRIIVRTRATVDAVCIDSDGRFFILEHKTGWQFPFTQDTAFSDAQITLQILAARANGYPVEYAVYNWIRTKEPTIPKINKNGSLSKSAIDTDLRTFLAVVDALDEWTDEIHAKIEELSDLENSAFFRRMSVTRTERLEMITLRDHVKLALRSAQVRENPENADRVLSSYICKNCNYLKVCMADLHNINPDIVRLVDYEERYDNRILLTNTN